MLETLSSIVGILGWVVTGAWMLHGWYIRREDKPRIGMSATLNRIYRNTAEQVVEIVVSIENTGEVRHVFKDITYSLRGSDTKVLTTNPGLLGQLDLPVVLADDQRLFPESWEYSFVDAGQTSTYRALIVIPAAVKLLKLSAIMKYEEKVSDFHSAVWYGYIG
jgi:hypothetical protein